MLSEEMAAKFAAEVRAEAEQEPEAWAKEAKKSAAKKIMAAFHAQDEEGFLVALSELKEMED